MNVYGLRVSFDEWVGSQGDLSNDDHVNVGQWVKYMNVKYSQAFEDFADWSIDDLVALVCE